MAKHVWTVLCKRAVVDTNEHNVSMFDVIEDVQIESAKAIPDAWIAVPLAATLVTMIVRSDLAMEEKCDVRITMRSSNSDSQENSWTVTIDLKEHSKARHIMRLKSLPIWGGGIASLCSRAKG